MKEYKIRIVRKVYEEAYTFVEANDEEEAYEIVGDKDDDEFAWKARDIGWESTEVIAVYPVRKEIN